MILADTSVWIEFFNKKSTTTSDQLESLLEQDMIVMCQPIQAELLSGHLTAKKRSTMQNFFSALPAVDPDWNAIETWDEMIRFSDFCHRHKLPLPGLVDRMILTATRFSNSKLWTLDRKLSRLAESFHLNYL